MVAKVVQELTRKEFSARTQINVNNKSTAIGQPGKPGASAHAPVVMGQGQGYAPVMIQHQRMAELAVKGKD